MKRLISILLIVITALYVLPVSGMLPAGTETVCKCMDESTDDNKDSKKDKSKEFFPAVSLIARANISSPANAVLNAIPLIPAHNSPEAPPPDKWA